MREKEIHRAIEKLSDWIFKKNREIADAKQAIVLRAIALEQLVNSLTNDKQAIEPALKIADEIEQTEAVELSNWGPAGKITLGYAARDICSSLNGEGVPVVELFTRMIVKYPAFADKRHAFKQTVQRIEREGLIESVGYNCYRKAIKTL